MCTSKTLLNKKPNGIKKILKREKPKLFRKKMMEECDVYIYDINSSERSDIEFGVDVMSKNTEEGRIFILVSDIMVWSGNGKKVKREERKGEENEEGENEERNASEKK
jgi:adenylate kinase